MKRLLILLAVAFVIIAGVLIHLVRDGISLRTAPLIRPSVMTENPAHVAKAVISRLFPDLQSAHYVLWGLPPQQAEPELPELLRLMQAEAEKTFGKPVHVLPEGLTLPTETLQACPAPCWVLLPKDQANELRADLFPTQKILPLGRNFVNITFVPFSGSAEVSPACIAEKRLSLECLIPVSIHEAQRKMKIPSERYFFMRKYNDRDIFLFTERRRSP